MLERMRELGLDPDRVLRQLKGCEAIGRAYFKLADSDSNQLVLIAAATNFRRAAANAALLGDTEAAQRLFSSAAQAYLQARSSYGLFLLIFGNERVSEPGRLNDLPPTTPNDVFRLWAPDSQGDADRFGKWRGNLAEYATKATGVLGIPVAAQLQLFDAAASSSPALPHVIAERLLPIVGTYSSALQRARADRYHWSRMAMPFHPLEPDVFGILISVKRRLSRSGAEWSSALDALPLRDDVRGLIDETISHYGAL